MSLFRIATLNSFAVWVCCRSTANFTSARPGGKKKHGRYVTFPIFWPWDYYSLYVRFWSLFFLFCLIGNILPLLIGIFFVFWLNEEFELKFFFGNSLRVIDAPLFFCFFRLPCIANPCKKICNVCSFDGSSLVLIVVIYLEKNLLGKMLIRLFANLISAFLLIHMIIGIVSSYFWW